METQTIDYAPVDVSCDQNGQPAGITLDEWMERLDRKLIAHYGNEFRLLLNQALAERGLLPIS